VEVRTDLLSFQAVKDTLEKTVPIVSAELAMVPKTLASLEQKAALQTLKLMERLEDLDDVQAVFTNLDISDELMAQIE
jgi:transcriptional/translational regulatory protein YebC/TACO1